MTTIRVLFNRELAEENQFTYTTPGGSDARNLTFAASDTITWTINSNSVPSGMTFSTASAVPGIKFAATASRPDEWPNSLPTGNATSWSVNDTVSASTAGTFAYRVSVVTPNGTLFSHDPDVTNSPQ